MKQRLLQIIRFFSPLILVLILWQAVAMGVQSFRGVLFPTPWQTGLRLLNLISGDPISRATLYSHLADSLHRWFYGFSIASFFGIGYGVLAGRIKWFEKATASLPQMILLVPGLAWIPVAILMFGIGETATVFMISVASFAPVAINTLDGIKNVNPHFIQAARMMGADRRILFFRVLIPAALPALISGLRIGLGTGWRVLVAAEMVVGTGTGLGYSIIQARWTLDYTSSFACIAVICMTGLAFEHLVFRQIEKLTLEKWAWTG